MKLSGKGAVGSLRAFIRRKALWRADFEGPLFTGFVAFITSVTLIPVTLYVHRVALA